ncbi:TetR/AcrR family transcriptional regulator [Cryptosporangium phraense]|uniref:TetR/AcrR family transcriptional regulator n=1 Tax=Cryptosporangium phraense TaxID=2593070 RepID=A0A545ATK5_9ACTN|nr:TetR/AcrR family transcriptional regulator [Cryptosporangium phraense]TQS44669.1 TetR/AcrR family transcriptional regulator [Cryptosporangium phraense]
MTSADPVPGPSSGNDVREPIWARPETRRRSTLSRAAIVAAAVDLADREGLAAVSIRRVAAELGARAMSLYTYLDSKDDLFDLMGDAAAGETLLPEPLPGDWRAALTLVAEATRDQIGRHPWVVPLMAEGRRYGGPSGLRHVEQSLRAVAGLGLPPSRQAQILMAVDDYVLGYLTRRSVGAAADVSGTLEHPYYRALLDAGEYPLLRDAMATGGYAEDSFTEGLNWLLDGIEASLPDPARTGSAAAE